MEDNHLLDASSIRITQKLSKKKELKKKNKNKEQKMYDQFVRDSMKEQGVDEDVWWKNSKMINNLTKDWPTYERPKLNIQKEVAEKFVDKLKAQNIFGTEK